MPGTPTTALRATLAGALRLALAAAAVSIWSVPVAVAQGPPIGRIAIEGVAAVSTSSRDADDPFVFLDLATTFRLTEGLDIVVRPYARRLPGGDWDALFYQAQIRYQPVARVRLDAGIISSPLGLGTLELRQDLNPTVGSPFYYFAPLPVFDQYSSGVQILSGGYPIGAMLNVSGTWWDVRGGVTDGTPARYRKIFANSGPSPAAQLVLGGGVTPIPGLRLGAGMATGKYRRSIDAEYYGAPYAGSVSDASAMVLTLEAEYAFDYTRVSGEWVRDRFETDGAPAIARGFYVQAVQTLTPRIFAASRLTRASSPITVATGPARWNRTTAELTAGYRLSPELTLKAGYEAGRRFGSAGWTHAAVGSIVWGKRWF